MRTHWRTVLLLLTIAAAPISAVAQTGAASLTGIVTDQSGATVPGATVTATHQATNVRYTAVSNEAGNYTVTSLPVGLYVFTKHPKLRSAGTRHQRAEHVRHDHDHRQHGTDRGIVRYM